MRAQRSEDVETEKKLSLVESDESQRRKVVGIGRKLGNLEQVVEMSRKSHKHPEQKLLEEKIIETIRLFEEKGWLEEGATVPLISKETLAELLKRKIITEEEAENMRINPQAAIFTRLYIAQDTRRLLLGELEEAALENINKMVTAHRKTSKY